MLDISKPVETRDGRKVTLFKTLIPNTDHFCHIGVIHAEPEDGLTTHDTITMWSRLGFAREQGTGISDDDLVNVKTKLEGWLNIYPSGNGGGYTHSLTFWPSAEDAKSALGASKAIARVYVEVPFEIGEGL